MLLSRCDREPVLRMFLEFLGRLTFNYAQASRARGICIFANCSDSCTSCTTAAVLLDAVIAFIDTGARNAMHRKPSGRGCFAGLLDGGSEVNLDPNSKGASTAIIRPTAATAAAAAADIYIYIYSLLHRYY